MQLIFLIFLNLPLRFIYMMAFMDAVKEIEAVCHKIVFQELFEFSQQKFILNQNCFLIKI